MASVFKPSGTDLWTASFRAWDAAKGKFVWRSKATGLTDEAKAMGVASVLERGSESAKAGKMTRQMATRMVNDIMRLAGLDELAPIPSFRETAEAMLKAANVSAGTVRKYAGQWDSFREWAGRKVDAPVSAIGERDMQDFYDHLMRKADDEKTLSVTTAGDHLNFASRVFGRAIKKGHRTDNPCLGVKRAPKDSVEKMPITRKEHAALLRQCREANNPQEWRVLASLGWHTGHRIQDLLDLTSERVNGDLVTITPRKKGHRGGRTVILPVPLWLAKRLVRLGNFKALHDADNRNGKISEAFVRRLKDAGIDPMPIERGHRVVHLRSFHSYRHAMTTRLTASGVTGEMARLVTDHDDVKVQQRYTHREIESLRTALRMARKK